ncbi:hypothetical protein EC973_000534 [Apophysomyces ossiformis]|uniref:Uncharacterized protein n=1 Tax=Apophysomyces ossiformis TaxID=679940 RepID=A0A8H7EPY3_9FUNG|nr:hypothetical protein EC973_000534 [Apophysomyces ossiformis]
MASTVYVGNIPSQAHPDDLKRMFNKYGRVVMVETKLGYAFVDMEDRRSCDEVIHRLNGISYMGNTLRVELAHSETDRRYGGPTSAKDTCYKCGGVGHFARNCPSGLVDAPRFAPPLPPPRRAEYRDDRPIKTSRDRYVPGYRGAPPAPLPPPPPPPAGPAALVADRGYRSVYDRPEPAGYSERYRQPVDRFARPMDYPPRDYERPRHYPPMDRYAAPANGRGPAPERIGYREREPAYQAPLPRDSRLSRSAERDYRGRVPPPRYRESPERFDTRAPRPAPRRSLSPRYRSSRPPPPDVPHGRRRSRSPPVRARGPRTPSPRR